MRLNPWEMKMRRLQMGIRLMELSYRIHTLDLLMASFQNGSGDHHSTYSRDVSGWSSARVF
jgi:hypothetical protein